MSSVADREKHFGEVKKNLLETPEFHRAVAPLFSSSMYVMPEDSNNLHLGHHRSMPCGLKYVITESTEKAPGLENGGHYTASLVHNPKMGNLPDEVLGELLVELHKFAFAFSPVLGRFRIGLNGPSLNENGEVEAHIMFPTKEDDLPRLVEIPDESATETPPLKGVLSTGDGWHIIASRKKAPGLVNGKHFITELMDNKIDIVRLPQEVFGDLLVKTIGFVKIHTWGNGMWRLIYNGPGLGTRSHTHIHAMILAPGDQLPHLVEHGDDGGDEA